MSKGTQSATLLFIFLLALPARAETPAPVVFRHFPVDSQVFIDGIPAEPDLITWEGEYRTFYVRPGDHLFRFEAPGYLPRKLPLNVTGLGAPPAEVIEGKQEKPDLPVYQIDETATAHQPKSVTFSPDGRYLAVASLGSNKGLQIFTRDPLEHVIDLIPPAPYAEKLGFVESLWLPGREEIWFSQMNTGAFHVYSTADWSYLGSYDAGGVWTKVLLADSGGEKVYLSHWSSENVTEVDTASRQVLRSFPVDGIPRGMTLSPDGSTLVTAIFSANALDSIDLETGEVTTKTYSDYPGAMRHLVSDPLRGLHYVTNMALGVVYALSDRTGRVRNIYRVGSKPNTAEMTPDGRYLFVSCRGPNNPESYLIEGHEYGRVYIIDLERRDVLGWIWGRDQTTGLDVSPDSRYLAFTDFKENILELYKIEEALP